MIEPHFDFEREAMAEGRRWVAGIDEVGRGPLAGPVGVAAVILDPDDLPQGLGDSKAISEAKGEALRPTSSARRSAFRSFSPAPGNRHLQYSRGAALRAMARAVGALSLKPDLALIDGRDVPDGLACPARAIIGGDALSMLIAAASIIAKTTRDALMRNLGLPARLCRSRRLCD